MHETACSNTAAAVRLRIESLPFSEIPGQSRLFLQYLADPLSLKKFYPSAVASHAELADRIPEVLERYATDREELCAALEDINRGLGASAQVMENISLLRKKRTIAVLTGQQAGLFTGPLYTVYKALTAVKMAEYLRRQGIDAVPVFWAATEDHDFEEVAAASFIAADGRLGTAAYDPIEPPNGKPVGTIMLDDSISQTIDRFTAELPDTEFKPQLHRMIVAAYRAGVSLGSAFVALISRLFTDYGLIVVDPLDSRIKKLAAPIYRAAVEKSDELVNAFRMRSNELAAEGFHAQVLVDEAYFPLFWHDDDGIRRSLKRESGEEVRVSGVKRSFLLNDLAAMAESEPERFSPGVMLRPVVQDHIFPTVCYFGGGAEIAYFAQNSEAYRVLDRPVTPILNRQSFTVIEAKHARTLAKFGIAFGDLFDGLDALLPRIVERIVDAKNVRLFPDAEERINTELNRLDQQLSPIDPTLARNLATRRRKIVYHIAALRDKYFRALLRKESEADRRISAAFGSLLPGGQLQERKLHVSTFLVRYGDYFVNWMYDAVDLDDNGHRVVYL